MSNLVWKQGSHVHFNKDFGGGTSSDRLILPSADNCDVKVTRFKFVKGFKAEGIVYDSDETVYLASGQLLIKNEDGESICSLLDGGIYHVPAGVSYNVEAFEDGVAICVFSRSADGGMPDDE